MYKNIIKTVLLSSVVISLASNAYSYNANDDFYLYSGLSNHKFTVDSSAKKQLVQGKRLYKNGATGFTVVGGKRFDEIGLEFGYTVLDTTTFKNTSTLPGFPRVTETLKHENSNFYVDFNNYFDMVERLELKTSIGVGVLQSKVQYNAVNENNKKIQPEMKNSTAEVKPRFGVGLQYGITREWSANLDVKYQLGNQYYKSMRASGLNVVYRF